MYRVITEEGEHTFDNLDEAALVYLIAREIIGQNPTITYNGKPLYKGQVAQVEEIKEALMFVVQIEEIKQAMVLAVQTFSTPKGS